MNVVGWSVALISLAAILLDIGLVFLIGWCIRERWVERDNAYFVFAFIGAIMLCLCMAGTLEMLEMWGVL